MDANSIINEFKFSKFQAVISLTVTLALYEPFLKMVRQALAFHEYYWFVVMAVILLLVYGIFIKPALLMVAGVPAITLTKSYLVLSQQGFTIEWADIEEMNFIVSGGKGSSYRVNLTLKDPWKYISQVRNPLLRYYRWYLLDYYNPFTVNLSMVEGDSYEIYDRVETCFHEYRRAESGI